MMDVEEVCGLPNSGHLFRRKNLAGGYTYYSDEIGGGIEVWDTALVSMGTLLTAMSEEIKRQTIEQLNKRKKSTE